MNRSFLIFLFSSFLFMACKSPKPAASGPADKKNLSGIQKTEVLNLFYNANKEKILGNLNNAAELFSEVIRKDAGNHAAMYELANIYAEQKKFTDALFFSKSAYKLDSKNIWYAISLAEIYQKNKKFSEAAQVLEQLVKDNSDRVDFYFEWATALVFADKTSEAIKAYDKLEERIGISREVTIQKSRLYQRMKRDDKAVAELQKFIALNQKDAQAYGMLAEVYQNMGEKQKALDTYNKVLEVDPNNAFIHLSLADFYRTNGEKEKSIGELKLAFNNKELDVETKISILGSYLSLIELHPELKDQAMELCHLLLEAHPSEAHAHAIHGDLLIMDKQLADARNEYREAIRLGAKEFGLVKSILSLDYQLQSWDTLVIESEDAISRFPDQPLVYFFNGVAYMQVKKYNEAIRVLNSGVKLVVDDKNSESDFYASLGTAYHEIKDFVRSDESFEKALQVNPKNSSALNNYAYFLSLRGEKLDKAEAMSKLSIELVPNSGTSEDTYGWIMYKQGKYKEAQTWLEKALSHDSDGSATVLEHYGDVLYKNGDTQKALEYWQKAKKAGDGVSEQLDKKILEKKLPD
ncbi:MAG: tetratricopeptide repeat protein [Bacteroidetes bacterium]|nr:tetratricopeptide repeat protein [Bacteroidota bacterium]